MFRSVLTVTSSALVSRILGFARDIMIARLLGSGAMADAWVAAFRFPNLFRRMFAEGAFNSAFIPLYAKIREKEGADKALEFANIILTVMFSVSFGVVILVQLLMPWLIYIFAPGFSGDLMGYFQQSLHAMSGVIQGGEWVSPILQNSVSADKLDTAVILTIICMPYSAFMFLVALYGGILNCHKRFWETGFVSGLLNICLIIAMFIQPFTPLSPVYALAWGCFTAGLVQVGFMMWGLYRAGYYLKFVKPQKTEHLKQFWKLLIPGILAGGVTQINSMIASIIASFQDGAMSYLYYTDRVYQLPLGSIGVALGIVLLPQLVTHIQKGHHDKAIYMQNRAIEFALLITIPASVAIAVIPFEIVQVLFERGSFTPHDTLQTSYSLVVYSVGLIGFILLKLFSPAYFAREDTKTPMRFAAISVAVDIVASVILFPFFGHVGIAIGTVIAGWVNVIQMVLHLYKRGDYYADTGLFNKLFRIALSAGLMGVFLYFGKSLFAYSVSDLHIPKGLGLLALCTAGIAVYFLGAFLLKALTIKELKGYLARGA